MCKNTHRYFGVNFLKRHLKRNEGSNFFLVTPTTIFIIEKVV